MASIDITGASVVISNVFALLDSQPIFGSSVTEISGVVGALGNIEIATKLRGSFVGVSSTDGFLNIATELKSSISVSSGINGYLNFRFLSVPIVAVSNVSGSLEFTYLTYEHSEESGEPVELYLFNKNNGAEYWSYTSTDYNIDYNGRTYIAALIDRSPIRLTANSLKTQIEIKVDLTNSFIRNFISEPIEGVIQLIIYRRHVNSYVTYWKGYVRGVKFKPEIGLIIAGLKTTSLARFGLMRKYQRLCGLPLYSIRCGVDEDDENFQITGIINIVNGRELDVTFPAEKPDNWGDNWLTGGKLETDNGNCLQEIVYHVGNILKIARSVSALSVGDTFVAKAGCNHLKSTCKTKFNNKLNYGGQAYLPDKNPFAGDAVI